MSNGTAMVAAGPIELKAWMHHALAFAVSFSAISINFGIASAALGPIAERVATALSCRLPTSPSLLMISISFGTATAASGPNAANTSRARGLNARAVVSPIQESQPKQT